eukprot:4316047-Amphidinium_carterae.1
MEQQTRLALARVKSHCMPQDASACAQTDEKWRGCEENLVTGVRAAHAGCAQVSRCRDMCRVAVASAIVVWVVGCIVQGHCQWTRKCGL